MDLPQFSIQYLRLSGDAYDKVKAGSQKSSQSVRKTKYAKEVIDRIWSYPLLSSKIIKDMRADFSDQFDKIKSYFLKSNNASYPIEWADLGTENVIFVLSEFGGSTARDVTVSFQRYTVDEPYLFCNQDNQSGVATLIDKISRDSILEHLKYHRTQFDIPLGDVSPGDGRMIEIAAGVPFRAEGSPETAAADGYFLSKTFLVPIAVHYKSLTGEILTLAIRPPLNDAIPVSNRILGMG